MLMLGEVKKNYLTKMNLQENISRIKEMMGLLTEEEKSYESKPIVFIGTAGAGKSTTAKSVAETLGIEYIDVDERLGSTDYEKVCKGKPSDAYDRCVLSKLIEKYGNSKVVLDIGGGTEKSYDLLTHLPNLFILGVPTNPNDDEPYLNLLKQSRIDRATKMGDQKLIDAETNMDTSHIQQSIDYIRKYYEGKQYISILNDLGKRKTPEELTQEIIYKLT